MSQDLIRVTVDPRALGIIARAVHPDDDDELTTGVVLDMPGQGPMSRVAWHAQRGQTIVGPVQVAMTTFELILRRAPETGDNREARLEDTLRRAADFIEGIEPRDASDVVANLRAMAEGRDG